MGWAIEKVKGGKFRIHADGYKPKVMTRDEILMEILKSRLYRLMEDFIGECKAFPFHWCSPDMRVHMDGCDEKKQHLDWVIGLDTDDVVDYETEVRGEFSKRVRELEEKTGEDIRISFDDKDEVRKFYDLLMDKIDLREWLKKAMEAIETRDDFRDAFVHLDMPKETD